MPCKTAGPSIRPGWTAVPLFRRSSPEAAAASAMSGPGRSRPPSLPCRRGGSRFAPGDAPRRRIEFRQAAVSVAAAAAAGFAAARLKGRPRRSGASSDGMSRRFPHVPLSFGGRPGDPSRDALHRSPPDPPGGILRPSSPGRLRPHPDDGHPPPTLVVFLGLEVFSISAYALTGLNRRDDGSAEGGRQVFPDRILRLGFVFGLALLFQASGTLDLDAAAAGLARTGAVPALAAAGLILVLCGLGIKSPSSRSACIFRTSPRARPRRPRRFLRRPRKRPDSPSSSGFSSPSPGRGSGPGRSRLFLSAAAVATMILGNFAALRQRNLKRLLAYSGIATPDTC